MKTSTLIRFACEPWLLAQQAINIMLDRAQMPFMPEDEDAGGLLDRMTKCENGTVIMPINGVLLHGVSEGEAAWLGGTTYESIRDALSYCGSEAGVTGVLLNINSPGGMAMGCAETADMIAGLADNKPVVALAEGQMCSGAYWLGAAADSVVASRSASVGSIGCYMALMDMSDMARKMGIDVRVFKSGALKGIGIPGAPVTENQAAFLQTHVERIGSEFRADVSRHRPQLTADLMDGRDVLGADSVRLGFADMVGGLDVALSELESWKALRTL